MRKSKAKFGSIAEKVKAIKENVGGSYAKVEEDGVYEALCVGVVYREDVESEYEGVKKVQDKVSYLFAVPLEDDDIATMQKEFTVSAFEQARILPLLAKFNLELEEFYKILGQTVRLSIEMKTSKKGKEYANIDKIMAKQKKASDIELEEDLELPYFFVENTDENLVDLLEGVTIKEDDTKSKKRKTRSLIEVTEEDIDDDDDADDVGEVDPFADVD